MLIVTYIVTYIVAISQRFLTPKHASPACTTYEDPRTALETTKRLSGLGKAPFGQTSARFRENRQAKMLPGTHVQPTFL